jgi:hypothetical protein
MNTQPGIIRLLRNTSIVKDKDLNKQIWKGNLANEDSTEKKATRVVITTKSEIFIHKTGCHTKKKYSKHK